MLNRIYQKQKLSRRGSSKLKDKVRVNAMDKAAGLLLQPKTNHIMCMPQLSANFKPPFAKKPPILRFKSDFLKTVLPICQIQYQPHEKDFILLDKELKYSLKTIVSLSFIFIPHSSYWYSVQKGEWSISVVSLTEQRIPVAFHADNSMQGKVVYSKLSKNKTSTKIRKVSERVPVPNHILLLPHFIKHDITHSESESTQHFLLHVLMGKIILVMPIGKSSKVSRTAYGNSYGRIE